MKFVISLIFCLIVFDVLKVSSHPTDDINQATKSYEISERSEIYEEVLETFFEIIKELVKLAALDMSPSTSTSAMTSTTTISN